MDPLIKSQLLYQLSYTPVPAPVLCGRPAARARKIREIAGLARARERAVAGAEKSVRAVDFSYLEGFLGGDGAVVLEVLALFRQQAEGWDGGLNESNPDWRAVAHTIKGAARGIGANALGDACQTAEFGEPSDLPAVRAALAEAVAEIAAYEAERRTA